MTAYMRECGRPSHEPASPFGVFGTMSERGDRQGSALVDDSSPEFSSFPPTIVARVGSQDQQQTERGSRDLAKGLEALLLERTSKPK